MDFDNIVSSWSGLVRVLVVGTLAYIALVLILRISGKRTLSKMNAFDLIVTVALGSTLATIILSKDVALLEGVLAFVLLAALQFAVTWSSVRSPAVSRLVKAEPTLLYYRGEFLSGEMRRERVVKDEITAAVRQEGMGSIDSVDAVVLETDGSFSVIAASDVGMSSLEGMLTEHERSPSPGRMGDDHHRGRS